MWDSSSPPFRSFGDLAYHRPVRAAADANDTVLSACTMAPSSGISVGQTLTKSTNGAITAEGAFSLAGLSVGDRVLLSQGGLGSVPAGSNGIWTVTVLGDATHPWQLTRATDADTLAELPGGSVVFVAALAATVGIPHWDTLFTLNGDGGSGAWLLAPQELDYLKVTGIIGPLTVDAPGGVGTTAESITQGDIVFGAGGVGAAGGAVRRGTASAIGLPGDALVPPGAIMAYGGTTAPDGWLLCQGQSLLRTDYADLFAVIGTTFGSVDGTHFTLPDLRQRFPLGKAAAGTGSTLGGTGGTIDHTHTGPSHTHTGPSHSHSHSHQTTYDSSGTATSWRARAFGTGSATNMTRFVNTTSATASMAYELTDTDATAGGTGATGAGGTGATGTANPPFQTVNYIIHV